MKRRGPILVAFVAAVFLAFVLRRVYELAPTKENYVFRNERYHSYEPELPAKIPHVPMVFYYKDLGRAPEFETLRYTTALALEQNDQVVMLTDHTELLDFGNAEVNEGVEFASLAWYDERADDVQARFVAAYKPRTRDPKRVAFEMACIQRYLALRAILRARNWDILFHLDNDVLTFSNLTKAWPAYQRKGCELVISMPLGGHPNAGSSFWTRKALDTFAAWVLEAYAGGKLDEWLADYRGDITDMIILKYFAQHMAAKPGTLEVCNGVDVYDGGLLNHRWGLQGGYSRYLFSEEIFHNYMEPTVFFDPVMGRPYFYSVHTGHLLKWHTLHMAGDAERTVHEIVCGSYTGVYRPVCERAAARKRWTFLLFASLALIALAALYKTNAEVRRFFGSVANVITGNGYRPVAEHAP